MASKSPLNTQWTMVQQPIMQKRQELPVIEVHSLSTHSHSTHYHT